MANATFSHGYTLPSHGSGLLNRVRAAVADYRAYLAILGELESLSDRDLADVGVSRFNIKQIAREAVYGR